MKEPAGETRGAGQLFSTTEREELAQLLGEPFFWGVSVPLAVLLVGLCALAIRWILSRLQPPRPLEPPRWKALEIVLALGCWFVTQIFAQAVALAGCALAEVALQRLFLGDLGWGTDPVASLAAGLATEALRTQAQTNVLSISMLAANLATFGGVLCTGHLILGQGPAAVGLAPLGANLARGAWQAVLVLPLFLIGFWFVATGWVLALIGVGFDPPAQEAVRMVRDTLIAGRWDTFLVFCLLAVVAAPLVEELLFRGLLLRWIQGRWGTTVAVLVSSVLFGLWHGNLAASLPLAVVGVVLALLYVRTGNLWAAIWLHAGFNAIMLGMEVARELWVER